MARTPAPAPDFQDRLAARLLGVELDATPAEIRTRFRALVRATHPDTSVAEACVDLGRLAEAKDRLVARAERAARAACAASRRRAFEPAERIGLLVDVAC